MIFNQFYFEAELIRENVKKLCKTTQFFKITVHENFPKI